MRKIPVLLVHLAIIFNVATPVYAQLSVHEVQFTTDPAGNSPYLNQTVQVRGVVTAVEYTLAPYNHCLFIADTTGGEWSGLLVASFSTLPADTGDWVEVSGQVKETGGQTSIQFPTLTTLGTAPLPAAALVTTAQFNTEPYEGVLCVLNDVTVSAPQANNIWRVQDATGEANVGHTWPYAYQPAVGDSLFTLTGQNVWVSGSFRLEPRYDADLIFSGNPRPAIAALQYVPHNPDPSMSVLVRCRVMDDDPLDRVELHYSADGVIWDSLEMVQDDSLHTGLIPPHPQSSQVRFFVLAEDAEGAISQEPATYVSYTVNGLSMDSLLNHFSQFSNQTVTLEGLVTYIMEWTTSGGSSRITAYLQDGSGRGIELSQSGGMASFPGLVRGYYVSLHGLVGEFEGSAQISEFDATDITVIYPNWPMAYVLPDTFLRTGDPQNDDLLATSVSGVMANGTWCRAKGYLLSVESAGGGRNLTLNDGSGNLVVRIWDDMNVPGVIANGDTVAFTSLINQVVGVAGAASWYDGFQIEAGYAVDFQIEAPFEPASPEAKVSVDPHPFVPDIGETITINFNAPAGAWIRLRLLNLKGQLCAMIRDQQSGGGYQIEWDGRDELLRPVPVGVYILQLQSTLNGKTTIASAPVVVGTRLK
jgi:hypothetical protein